MEIATYTGVIGHLKSDRKNVDALTGPFDDVHVGKEGWQLDYEVRNSSSILPET